MKIELDPNMRSYDALVQFITFCMTHPNLRFWQALLAMTEFSSIIGRKGNPQDYDTFGIEGTRGFRQEFRNE